MANMVEITCACGCGKKKLVRIADVERGWGKYYSKSCKARHQNRRYNYKDFEDKNLPYWCREDETLESFSGAESGYWGHGQS